MKYFIIAGETSGDLHGSNLVKHLRIEDPEASITAWGGDLMQAQGAVILKHYKELSFMGFVEVLMNIFTIFKNFSVAKKQIIANKPDVIILIDFPGFNLRMASWAKKKGYKVFYYISPQIWAWKENRVHKIKQCVDEMFVILPFEKAFYQKYNYNVHYVGHPLLDAIHERKLSQVINETLQINDKPIIALLPGSRKQEISVMLAEMITVCDSFPDHQFIVCGLDHHSPSFYQSIIGHKKNVSIAFNRTYDVLSIATAALVTSGTATLETALFKVPEVVCYKGSRISYEIGKRLIKVKYISLVNLILDKPLVTELIQDELNKDNLILHLNRILTPTHQSYVQQEYDALIALLGNRGASSRCAVLMTDYLQHHKS
jgi:lipid-A-disaccharide synthase